MKLGQKRLQMEEKGYKFLDMIEKMDKKCYKRKWKKGYKHNKYNWTEAKSEGGCRSARKSRLALKN